MEEQLTNLHKLGLNRYQMVNFTFNKKIKDAEKEVTVG